MFSVGWSRGKESMVKGKPDLCKGSFYFNPLFERPSDDPELIAKYPAFYESNIWPEDEVADLKIVAPQLGR